VESSPWTAAITLVVAPLMLAELVAAGLLCREAPRLGVALLVPVAVAWAVTAFWAVPMHGRLDAAFLDTGLVDADWRSLCLANHVRAVAWTLRAGVLLGVAAGFGAPRQGHVLVMYPRTLLFQSHATPNDGKPRNPARRPCKSDGCSVRAGGPGARTGTRGGMTRLSRRSQGHDTGGTTQPRSPTALRREVARGRVPAGAGARFGVRRGSGAAPTEAGGRARRTPTPDRLGRGARPDPA
jgi:hypothetical protein